jgi:hypothetical protein
MMAAPMKESVPRMLKYLANRRKVSKVMTAMET